MADCVLVDVLPVCENVSVNENDMLLGSSSEDNSSMSDSVKSEEYFDLSDALCSKFYLNGVKLKGCSGLDSRMMGSDTEEFTAALKSISEENGHDCRKKRCADRYDSSESSDSGVATLSCTDCSGSSCGTSDFTEPGSPFSTSSHSESEAEMPPTQSADTAGWPWERDRQPPQRYLYKSQCCLQQGKITEYFKAQLKTQKKCEAKLQIRSCDVRDKLAVHISGVAAKLPLVFQQKNVLKTPAKAASRALSPSPVPRKSVKLSSVQVTSVFSNPDTVTQSLPTDSVNSVLSHKPKTPSVESVQKTACSTPIPSPPVAPTSPLLVSTVEHCLDKPSLPSPILRTPSIIRFPARNGWKGHFLSDIVCRWSQCEEYFSTTTALLEHLQMKHVNTQSLKETFVCLWTGCKVYDRASCSRSWLERHVLSHGGNKPFRCIVDGCGHRFSSQIMLERHVNQHFNQSESSASSGGAAKKSLDSTPNKLFRRNGKKLRYRRQPFSARTFDFIDTGIMEGLQHSLLETTKMQTLGNRVDCAASSSSVTLHSKVVGRKVFEDGTTKLLLRWFPLDIVDDEWVPESEQRSTKQVSWKQCEPWVAAPLFHQRPSHNKRKQSAIR